MKRSVDQHRDSFGIEPICKALRIAPADYRRQEAQLRDVSKRSARAKHDQALRPEIKRVREFNTQVYGVPKVWKQINREGFAETRCTVGRLMKLQGLRGAVRNKRVDTTISDMTAERPQDRFDKA